MRTLLIDETAKQLIVDVINFAEKNRYPRFRMHQLMHGKISTPGDVKGHCCCLFDGFRIVFTIEEQPIGWCHHLSISVNSKNNNKLPNVEAVNLIMKEFGIQKSLEDCHVYVEDSFIKSVNIISKI